MTSGPALLVVFLAASVAGPGHAHPQQGRGEDCVTSYGFLGDCVNRACPGRGSLSPDCAAGQTCCVRVTVSPARPQASGVSQGRPQASGVSQSRPQVTGVNRPPPRRRGTAPTARRRPTLLNPQFECGGQPAPDSVQPTTAPARSGTTRDPSAIVFPERRRRDVNDISPGPEPVTVGMVEVSADPSGPPKKSVSLQEALARIYWARSAPLPNDDPALNVPNSIISPPAAPAARRRHRRQTAEEREGFEVVWQEYQQRVRSGTAAAGFTRAQLLEAYRAAAAEAEKNAPPSAGGGWVCGAVLISERYMLTAAHCLGAGRPQVVRLGDRNLTTTDDGAPQDYRVEDVIQHPEYRHPLVYHDLALLRLDRTVQFSQHVRPFCLYDGRGSLDGKVSHVSGWGATEFGGDLSNILLGGNVTIWSRPRCDAVYQTQPGFKRRLSDGITPGLLCAGGEEQDACQGDSGGPMTVVTDRGTRLVGIVSSGIGCASPGIPGLYTNVASYLKWIDGVVYGGNMA